MIHLDPGGTKEKRRKRVPIHRNLVPILDEAMQTSYSDSALVFLVHDAYGVRIPGNTSIDNPWPRACKALAEEKILRPPYPHFHDLRHT
jgi:integrase